MIASPVIPADAHGAERPHEVSPELLERLRNLPAGSVHEPIPVIVARRDG